MTARKLRASYLREFPACQYEEAAGRYADFGRHIHSKVCVDHIWPRGRKCSDTFTNYMTSGPGAHDWKHHNLTVSRICAMWFKWDLSRRTGERHHFDLDALRAAAGFWIPGWVENKMNTVPLPEWCVEMGWALIEGCG